MYGVAGDKATDLDQIGRFLFNFGNPNIGHMFGYEHERVCFARIGECDGGMSATISHTENYKY
jgi:hypothetical protein